MKCDKGWGRGARSCSCFSSVLPFTPNHQFTRLTRYSLYSKHGHNLSLPHFVQDSHIQRPNNNKRINNIACTHSHYDTSSYRLVLRSCFTIHLLKNDSRLDQVKVYFLPPVWTVSGSSLKISYFIYIAARRSACRAAASLRGLTSAKRVSLNYTPSSKIVCTAAYLVWKNTKL